jgi:hypothetical protein
MEELLKLRSEVNALENNLKFYNNLSYEFYSHVLREKESKLLELELLNLFRGV